MRLTKVFFFPMPPHVLSDFVVGGDHEV